MSSKLIKRAEYWRRKAKDAALQEVDHASSTWMIDQEAKLEAYAVGYLAAQCAVLEDEIEALKEKLERS